MPHGAIYTPRAPYLSHADQAALVARLAALAGVRPPRFTPLQSTRGYYRPLAETIFGGVTMTRDNVLHEVAHHVVHTAYLEERQAAVAKWDASTTRHGLPARPAHHGRAFWWALVRLIKLDGRQPGDYDWRREYRIVYKFAVRRGWVEADARAAWETEQQRLRAPQNFRRER